MIWAWHTRPLECETIRTYPFAASPDGALVATVLDEACVEGTFSTVVRTRVEVGAVAAAGPRAPVLTVWETAMLRPAVLLSWTGPRMLDIGLVEPRSAELYQPTVRGLSVRVTTGALAGP